MSYNVYYFYKEAQQILSENLSKELLVFYDKNSPYRTIADDLSKTLVNEAKNLST